MQVTNQPLLSRSKKERKKQTNKEKPVVQRFLIKEKKRNRETLGRTSEWDLDLERRWRLME